MDIKLIEINGTIYMCRLEDAVNVKKSNRQLNAQIIRDFLDIYRASGMRTVVKVDKLALTETTLFKQFMEVIADEYGASSMM